MSTIRKRLAHTRQRTVERYGVVLSREKMAALVHEITEGRSVPVPDAHRSLAIRCHVVKALGLPEMAVLYDKNRKIIVTVLPDNSAEMQHYRAGQP